MSRQQKPKPKTPREPKRRAFWNRIQIPATLIIALLALVVGAATYFRDQSVPPYLETNGGMVTRMTPNGLGTVRQSANFASAYRVLKRLPKQSGARPTDSDKELVKEADRLYRLGEHRQASAAYLQLERKFPQSPDLHLNLSVTLELQGDFEGAEGVLRDFLASRPALTHADTIALAANLLQAFAGAGDSTRARALAASHPSLAMDPVASNALGVLAYAQGHFEEAARQFKRASEQSKGLPVHDVNVAAAVLDGGDPSRARSVLSRLDESTRNSGDAQGVLGRYYLAEGDVAAAQQAFARARATQPGRPDFNYNSAVAFASTDPDSARHYFQLASMEVPALRAVPPRYEHRTPVAVPVSAPGDARPAPGPSNTLANTPASDASGTQVAPTGATRDRAPTSGIHLHVVVTPRPGPASPGTKEYWGEGAAVFGSAGEASRFRGCSLNYGNSQIDAGGAVVSPGRPTILTGNASFEEQVRSWLIRQHLATSGEPFEARIEATVVVLD